MQSSQILTKSYYLRHHDARPAKQVSGMNKSEEFAVAEALNQLRARHNNRDVPAAELVAPGVASGIGLAAVDSKPVYATEKAAVAQVEHTSRSPSVTSDEKTAILPAAEPEPVPAVLTPVPSEGVAAVATPDGQPQWRNVLLTATSLVLTKDARKKLRHLLSVLRLASEHLNTKVNALKQAMEQDADNDKMKPKISKVAIRNDIITTIKKCLAMLSTLATNTLPAAARGRIRNTLLKLPSRWANQLGNETITEADGKSESAALALATETLISIQNITNILSESMDRADSWVERLPSFSLGKRRRGDVDVEADKEGETSSQPSTRPESPAEEPGAKAIKRDSK